MAHERITQTSVGLKMSVLLSCHKCLMSPTNSMLLKAHGVLEADFFHHHVEYKY